MDAELIWMILSHVLANICPLMAINRQDNAYKWQNKYSFKPSWTTDSTTEHDTMENSKEGVQ